MLPHSSDSSRQMSKFFSHPPLLKLHKCWAASWIVLACLSPGIADDKQRTAELRREIQPLLEEHCLGCHSGAEPDAGLTLDHFDTPLDFLKGRSVWEKAVQKMQIEEMPPPDSSDLEEEDRKRLISWISETINEYECGLEPNPGKVTLRRLNASEYQNTIRDLFGLSTFKTASTFPGDDVGYGFDNIGDVLTLPPLLMEKYLLEAERISRALIQIPPGAETYDSGYPGGKLQVESKNSNSQRELTLASAGAATFNEQIPWSGPYQLTITASGDQAGNEPVVMGVVVDKKLVRRIAVPNERESPTDFTVPLRLRAGNRQIAISFLNDFYRAAENGQPQQDRNLIIHYVQLLGKKKAKPIAASRLSKFHKEIIFTSPRNERDRERATRDVVSRLASRAFRRPIDSETQEKLTSLAMSVQDEGDSFEESIQVALQAILISPQFIFRVEPPKSGDFSTYRDLDEFELATRLSYFLWSSMPDDALLKLAWQNKLREGDNLRFQIIRMIKDKKANAFVSNFAGQWLTLRKLRDFEPDKSTFPNWNEDVKKLVEYETLAFFAGVMRGNMSVLRLLDAKFTYLNEELASFYGISGVSGEEFRPVSLKGIPRAGLLTQASVLAVTSNPTRTSPVKRGKWILENLLDKPPPPAPPGVPELEEAKRGELTGSLRQRLEQHRSNPACANCHKLMDPLGFALENFDAIGLYRTKDGTLPIDASGQLPGGETVNGAEELQTLLTQKHKDAFVECLTEKMLTYAIGRGLEYYDKCAVDKIVQKLQQDDYKFATLIEEIVKSDPFQKKGERDIE